MTSTARLLDRLDALCLAVARAVMDAGEPCTTEAVLDAFDPSSRERASAALTYLRELALVWGEVDSLRLVRSARESLGSTPRSHVEWPAPEILVTERDVTLVEQTAGQHALATVMGVTALAESWAGDDAPAVLRKGGMGVRDLTSTARHLDVSESTAALWIETAYAAGLIARDGESGEHWRPTEAYDVWHDLRLPEQWVALARAWWSCQRAPVRIAEGANALSDDVLQRGMPALREQVAAVLANLPLGSAPEDPSEVTRTIDSEAPRQAGPIRDGRIRAVLDELEVLGFSGGRALAAMGRAAAGFTTADPVALATEAMPAPLDHVLIQADLTAVAPGPLLPDLARELRLIADVESTGGAVVYRFSVGSIRRALDAGRDAASLLDFLRGLSRTPVPQPLEYLIEDAERRHGIVRVGIATAYIRCEEESALAALLADSRAKALGCVRVSPTVVTVSGSIEDAIGVLRDLGLHPVAETVDGRVSVALPRRAPTPRAPSAPPVTRRDAAPALIAAAITTLRSSIRGEVPSAPLTLEPMPAADTITVLRRAIADAAPVWVAHGDEEVLIDPIRLAAGSLTGVDRVTGEVRTFAVARLGAAELADATN